MSFADENLENRVTEGGDPWHVISTRLDKFISQQNLGISNQHFLNGGATYCDVDPKALLNDSLSLNAWNCLKKRNTDLTSCNIQKSGK
jgi:hypothetical protein